MLETTSAPLDYFSLIKQAKRLSAESCRATLKIALLADCSTQQLVPLLKTLFHKNGIHAEIYEAEYDTIELEVFNKLSKFYSFGADLVVILNSANALRANYYAHPADKQTFLEETLRTITGIWDEIRAKTDAPILQSTYVLPHERLFGNYDLKVPTALLTTAQALNQKIAEASRLRASILINDLDHIAAYQGRKTWSDERLWIMGKYLCALEHLPRVAQNIVEIALSLRGAGLKCIVLDLDNTLWGGIIGEDGLEGIRIGELGEGEAFTLFQRFLLELKRRGILLAVCSKNDPQNALRPFREHPEMVLKEADIAVFVANWKNKAENIRQIRDILNIGLDSMLFLDDDPFERNLVRQYLPDIRVPELPEDPANYVKALCELNLFETTSLSELDEQRTQIIQQDAQRLAVKEQFSDIQDYLKSLDMKITLARFDPYHLPRIAQLIQRSNQFNLTTKRYSQAECGRFMKEEASWFPFYLSLKDKFGDSGLISVVILKVAGRQILIDEWIMSCRVLLRGVEQYAMNFIAGHAQKMGCSEIIGEYNPTPKNGMVKEFYRQFGFEPVSATPEGWTVWRLLAADYKPKTTFFKEEG